MSQSFTDAQLAAVERRAGPLLISAAAGSGKTSVLVERFARAVLEDDVRPDRILTITFTRRAAGELRKRIRESLLAAGRRDAAGELEAAYIGTVHSFCGRIVRSNALDVGVDPRFTVIEDALADAMRDEAFEAALAARVDVDPHMVDVLAAIGIDEVKPLVLGAHDRLRSLGQDEPCLPKAAGEGDEREAAIAVASLDGLLGEFGWRYARAKRERAVLDFDDLELYASRLLTDPRIRTSWSGRFDLVMVDEFQDTNRRQLAILEAVDEKNLCAVGDEMQSIYGFRHADVEIFRERRAVLEEWGAHIALEGNFRCAPPILTVVERVLSSRPYNELPPQVAMRETQEKAPRIELLVTIKGKGDEWDEDAGWAAGLPKAAMWRRAEAALLAQRLAALVGEGRYAPGEIAVLMRAGTQSRVYEVALQRAGLNTIAATGDFWSHEQVLDLLNVLRVVANPADDEALYGVLSSPLAELDSDGLLTVAQAARGSSTAWAAICDADVRAQLGERPGEAVATLVAHVEMLRSLGSTCSIGELIERTAHSGGYRRHVLALDGGARRLANVHKLMRVAERWESTEGRDLRRFLDTAATLAEKPERHAAVGGDEPDAVRLMTIHSAKGLEFPVVAVADLGHKSRNTPPRLLFDGERVGLRWPDEKGEGRPRLHHAELAKEAAAREAAEEDRLLYVAMTRAQEHLILSGAAAKWGAGEANDGAMGWLGRTLIDSVDGELAQTVVDIDGASVAVRKIDPQSASRELEDTAPEAQPDEQPVPEAVLRLAEPDPRPHAPLPERLSYSSLSQLQSCGYRYYLTRVLGLPEREQPSGSGLAGRDRGTLVHALLELHGPQGAAQLGPAAVLEQGAKLGIRLDETAAAQICALLAGAAQTRFANRIAAGGRTEVPFTFSIGDELPLIDGVIDLLDADAERHALVVDYKSDRVDEGTDLEAMTAERYGLQRLVYALAALRAGVASVEVAHWYLARPEAPALAHYEAADRPALEADLAVRIEAALGAGYRVTSSPERFTCQGCPGLGSLCAVEPGSVGLA